MANCVHSSLEHPALIPRKRQKNPSDHWRKVAFALFLDNLKTNFQGEENGSRN